MVYFSVGLDIHHGTRWQTGYVAIYKSVYAEVTLGVQISGLLNDGEMFVARVENHFCVACKLST